MRAPANAYRPVCRLCRVRFCPARGAAPAVGQAARPGGRSPSGFTMVEMMVVISIVLILLAIAVPSYKVSIIHAKETILRQDLYTLRSMIGQYTEDKDKAPQSLDDLVSAGYLKQIPVDPFTNSNTTWQTSQDDALYSIDQQEPGISDVHSGSNLSALDGSTYSEW
jgi:general secretion pathway protein G